ncbi:unnamed protein product [Symbiodinium necroappetens]|uniref:Uncharacterized protein n=1 Tax=Symbiodinium necroappetens TaxID=1628268 RepID=A0A812RRH9_9DINO|nr:unnamed protein product [Symbiodinium necroappetens]
MPQRLCTPTWAVDWRSCLTKVAGRSFAAISSRHPQCSMECARSPQELLQDTTTSPTSSKMPRPARAMAGIVGRPVAASGLPLEISSTVEVISVPKS